MDFILNRDINSFTQKVGTILEQDKWLNHQLSCSLRNGADMFCVLDMDRVLLAGNLRKNGQLLVYETEQNNDALNFLVSRLESLLQAPKSLLAETSLAQRFVLHTKQNYEEAPKRQLMTISTAIMPMKCKGKLKVGTKNDIDKFTYQYSRAFGDNYEDIVKTIECFFRKNGVFILEDNGEFVSGAMLLRNIHKLAYLGGIFTVLEEQGKGYGTSCVIQLTNYLFQLGYLGCGLDVLEDNLVAKRLYEKLGYTHITSLTKYVKI